DGLFYATNVATRSLMSGEECRRFQRPFDLRVLEAGQGGPVNPPPGCGGGIPFDEFTSYPPAAFSWGAAPGHPRPPEVPLPTRRRGRVPGPPARPVGGAFPANPYIASTTAESLAGRARQAIGEMKGRWLLLGPDCSINPDTPEPLLHAAGAAARDTRPA